MRINIKEKQEGSTILFVLIVILIFVAIGSSVLSLSMANLKMGHKTKQSSKEFYQLDSAAEKKIEEVDSILAEAEAAAAQYMKYEIYTQKTIDMHKINEIEAKEKELDNARRDAQNTSRKPYKNYAKLKPYFESNPSIQEFFFENWAAMVKNPSTTKAGTIDVQAYNTALDMFFEQAFPKVYYSKVYEAMNDYIKGKEEVDVNGDGKNDVICNIEFVEGDIKYNTLNSALRWEDSNENNKKAKMTFKMVLEDIDNSKKKLIVVGEIIAPQYMGAAKKDYIPIMANPIYTNAISAGGNIEFGGNNVIRGDVQACGENSGGGNIYITSKEGTKIYGNAYAYGDIKMNAVGHNESRKSILTIQKYNSAMPKESIKDKVLGETEYRIQNMSEGMLKWALGNPTVPFIYKDNQGGNVYCNNLGISESASNSGITIAGNLITLKSILNDAQKNGIITIGKNYIGLSENIGSEQGSCVINSQSVGGLETSNFIDFYGKTVVPGTQIIYFDNNSYYNTKQSVGPRIDINEKNDVFTLYESQNGGIQYVKDGNSYQLFNEDRSQMKNRWENKKVKGIRSWIRTDSTQVGGYTEGTFIVSNQNDYFAYSPEVRATDATLYQAVIRNSALKDIFEMKTKHFGTSDLTISNAVDKDAIPTDKTLEGVEYYDGDMTLSVNRPQEAIIYCAGNLTLEGSGTIKGSVICEGDLKINGDITIEYDENVIRKNLFGQTDGEKGKITSNQQATKFFAPGAKGKEIIVDERKDVDAKARNCIDSKRYSVLEWKEE